MPAFVPIRTVPTCFRLPCWHGGPLLHRSFRSADLAILALAGTMDEHAPWTMPQAVLFNAPLFCISAAILAFIDLYGT